jgi:rhodanese-related sulfurtransferase
MLTSVKQMMEAANAVVPKITPAEAREMIAKGNTLVVDVRDAQELEKSGKIAGAVHHSRGFDTPVVVDNQAGAITKAA